MYRIVLSAIVLMIGILVAGEGAGLAARGVSWFQLALGIGFIVSAGLLWDRRPLGLSVYALTLLATLALTLATFGLDWWALSARGAVLVSVGLLLLLPPMVRAMHAPGLPQAVYGPNSATLVCALLVTGLVGGIIVWAEGIGPFADEQAQPIAELSDRTVQSAL